MRRVPPVPTTRRADVNVPHAVLRAIWITGTAMLAGCAAFSPNGGMDAVQGIVGSALNKDVVALRTPEDAEIARAGVVGLLRLPLWPMPRFRSRF